MYSNFLEAKCYFSHWRLKDLFEAINKINVETYQYPQQWGTWESGFFSKVYTDSQNIPKIKEAFTLAGISGETFDDEYIAHSADKRISMVLAQKIARHFGTSSTIVEFDPFHPLATWDAVKTYGFVPKLLEELEHHYGDNILSIAKAYFDSDYNPIENYSMVEVETPDITRTKTGTSSNTETPNITRSTSGSSSDDEETHAETNTDLSTSGDSSAGVFGFNSGSTSVPLSDASSSQRTQGSKTNNYTDGTRSVDSTESKTETETGTRAHSATESATETETGERELTRSGNIGVTTSQQMLQSEIELRRFDFMEEVFRCFDRILCGSVY